VPGNVLDPTNFKLKKSQEIARVQAIPLQKIVPSVEPGWVGKQKGTLQVAWEQGWIDAARLGEQCILGSCLDFANEATELQTMRDKMDSNNDADDEDELVVLGELLAAGAWLGPLALFFLFADFSSASFIPSSVSFMSKRSFALSSSFWPTS
jgi:hypothetical protein